MTTGGVGPPWARQRALPYLSGMLLGLGYGVFARFVFEWRGDAKDLLVGAFAGVSVCFLFMVPFGLGVLTASQVPATATWRWLRFALLPIAPALLLMVVAAGLAWEGLICLVLAAPVYFTMAVLGGVVMGAVIVGTEGRRRSVTTTVAIATVLPFAMAPVEARLPAPNDLREVATQVAIDAPAQVVWREIVRVPEIAPAELGFSPFAFIGIPRPKEATLDHDGPGGLRTAVFHGGIRFDERITEWKPESSFAFDIDVDPATVRPDVLDRHVLVGGVYFDVLHGRFRIEPRGRGVVLHLSSLHRLTTRLNPYAGYWTDAIMSDIQQSICQVLKRRSEERRPWA